jgi:hypothetical protein
MFLYDFQNELVVVFIVENIEGGFFPCSISCLIAINEKVHEDKNFDWPCPVGSQYFYFTQ